MHLFYVAFLVDADSQCVWIKVVRGRCRSDFLHAFAFKLMVEGVEVIVG